MQDYEVSKEHPYYEEIETLFCVAVVLQLTARALTTVSSRNSIIDKGLLGALDDYIDTLSAMSADVHERKK